MRELLNDEQEKVLKVLYEELTRNPRTSLVGIDEKTLGYKVGAYLGIGVMYSVAHLETMGLVTRQRGRVIISQKGIDQVNPNSGDISKLGNTNMRKTVVWLRDHIVAEIIVGVIVALLVYVITTGWRPW